MVGFEGLLIICCIHVFSGSVTRPSFFRKVVMPLMMVSTLFLLLCRVPPGVTMMLWLSSAYQELWVNCPGLSWNVGAFLMARVNIFAGGIAPWGVPACSGNGCPVMLPTFILAVLLSRK